jgi:RimJ/RimL family protein N-acetyltransferase
MSLPTLATGRTGVELRPLTVEDADAYHDLLVASAAHLTRHGDYEAEAAQTRDETRGYFENPWDDNLRFGIWVDGALVGRIDLNPVNPPKYSVGYWLTGTATGHGYATEALTTLTAYARDVLGATDLYAGITHGNTASEAVAVRAGFAAVATFDAYTRFHMEL